MSQDSVTCNQSPTSKETQPKDKDKSDIILLILLVIFLAVYFIVPYFIEVIAPVKAWPDVLAYIWINIALGSLWWKNKGQVINDTNVLSLGQSTMGSTIQAGIVATSIFIPLSLAAITIMTGGGAFTIPAHFRSGIENLIIAVFWFGLSTIFGVTTLMYMNQKIGENVNVLRERLIGIPTNLQYWALIMGTLRVLYALYLVWVRIGIGLS